MWRLLSNWWRSCKTPTTPCSSRCSSWRMALPARVYVPTYQHTRARLMQPQALRVSFLQVAERQARNKAEQADKELIAERNRAAQLQAEVNELSAEVTLHTATDGMACATHPTRCGTHRFEACARTGRRTCKYRAAWDSCALHVLMLGLPRPALLQVARPCQAGPSCVPSCPPWVSGPP